MYLPNEEPVRQHSPRFPFLELHHCRPSKHPPIFRMEWSNGKTLETVGSSSSIYGQVGSVTLAPVWSTSDRFPVLTCVEARVPKQTRSTAFWSCPHFCCLREPTMMHGCSRTPLSEYSGQVDCTATWLWVVRCISTFEANFFYMFTHTHTHTQIYIYIYMWAS